MRLDFGPFLLLFILLACAYVWSRVRLKRKPALALSESLTILRRRTFRTMGSTISSWLFWAALLFIAVALCHPRRQETLGGISTLAKSAIPRSGIAIYFLLDESGSMSESVTTRGAHGNYLEMPKIDIAKRAITEFIEGKSGLNIPERKNDLVGLIGFARIAEVLCPLTLNRAQIETKLNAIEPIKEDARNGTAIGYAIFKAVNIIVATKYYADRQKEEHKSVYSIANQAIVIITDGLQSPNPADKENPFRFMPPEEAIRYAKDNGVKVFYIGVDPVLGQSDFADEVNKMREAMRGSGGELFLASASLPVEDILAKIDEMEKSEIAPQLVAVQNATREVSKVYFFITLAMISLAAAVLLETLVVRQAP